MIRPRDETERSRHNELLRWASERASGSIDEFARACAELALEATYRTATALGALGHVEFDHHSGHFAACPPTLAALPGRLPFYLFTGARPSGAADRLLRLADPEGVCIYPPFPQEGGPDTILVEGRAAQVAELCDTAGVVFARAAGPALAARLPVLELETVGERVPPPRASYPARGVPPGSVRPHPPGGDPMRAAEGACAMVSVHGRLRRWFVYLKGSWWWIPIREYAAYLTGWSYMRRFPDDPFTPIDYSPAERTLTVAGDAPLPPLHARAAILCSGRLPRLEPPRSEDPGAWPDQVYDDVDLSTADAIIYSLDDPADRKVRV